MTIRRHSARPTLLLLLCFALPVQAGEATPASAPPTAAHEQETNDGPPEDGLRRYAVSTGGGCVAGAIAGTVVPGLGNAVGCALGALGGWLVTWMNEPEDFLEEDR